MPFWRMLWVLRSPSKIPLPIDGMFPRVCLLQTWEVQDTTPIGVERATYVFLLLHPSLAYWDTDCE